MQQQQHNHQQRDRTRSIPTSTPTTFSRSLGIIIASGCWAPLPQSVTPAIAQTGFEPGPPPPLPDPPALESWLFERPAALAVVLLVIGIITIFALNRAGKPKQGLWALGGFVIAAISAAVTSHLVVTERERLADATRGLVEAIVTADTRDASARIDADAEVVVRPLSLTFRYDEVIRRIGTDMTTTYRVAEHRIGRVQAVVDGPNTARTQVRVVAAQQGGRRAGTWWLLHWRLGTDGIWRLYLAECLRIDPGGLL